LPFFKQFIGKRHLDIGPGSGYYLEHGSIPEETAVTLLDLNTNSLNAAKQRLGRPSTVTIEADVTQTLPLEGVYDSISLFFLLHCLPGSLEEKMELFPALKPHLAQKGVVYGSTILGKGVQHNWFGTRLMNFYNSKGIFGNREDGEDEIRQALCKEYENVETRVVGCVLLFSASRPKDIDSENSD
jgi:SAM-dependent methyltransferase